MKSFKSSLFILIILLANVSLDGQKKITGADMITASGLESDMAFLASPLLKGRMNGEPGLEIAQQYIVSQVKLMGLKPANGESYYQPYVISKYTMDPDQTMISVINANHDTTIIKEQIYQLLPTGPSDYSVSGEVVFAGYALRQDKYSYNDFENLNAEGKILLVMNGAPTSEDGKKYLFEGNDWDSFMSIQVKLTALLFSRARAVIFVMGPKSGFRSFNEKYPGISGELSASESLKGERPQTMQLPNAPKILFADRSVADELLKGTGYTLEGLQREIDTSLKPHTFLIQGKQLAIKEVSRKSEFTLNNVAAIVEGSDPVLKNEYVIFSGHADHLGTSGNKVFAGADDNASGCAALLSMARAFQNLPVKPLRSILFLWVSGEEIGLFGSQSYINNPLVPLDKTVCDLNMDMIGRVRGIADTSKQNPVVTPNHVFVITGYQSKDLISIANEVDKSSAIDLDYSLSAKNNPLQLFVRSDHYNFARKDIPVLFFTTGEHTDYHTAGDVLERINFSNMELITRTMFQIGYNVANRKTRIAVDNPFTKW